MSCLPNTPIATNVLTATNSTNVGWMPYAPIITTALSQYYPLSEAIVTLDGTAHTSNQHMIIRQLEFEETAPTSGDIKKTPLLIALYSGTAPTAPTSGAVYNPSTTNLLGIVPIAASEYVRTNSLVWTATVNPNLYIRTVSSSTASTMYAVVLSDSATSVTYAAGAAARIRVFVEAATSY